LVEAVWPVTYALPELSMSMSRPSYKSVPPRKRNALAGYRYYFLGINGGWSQNPFSPLADALDNYDTNVGTFVAPEEDSDQVIDPIQKPNVHAFRSAAKPNTYGATAPHKWVGSDIFTGWFGVDMDQVPRLPGTDDLSRGSKRFRMLRVLLLSAFEAVM
jgi:hypothetical protein